MLNDFILAIWDYKNDKKFTPLRFLLNYARNMGVGGGGGVNLSLLKEN